MAQMHESNEIHGVTEVKGSAEFTSFVRTDVRAEQRFPRIDDHLVKPEVSRYELIRGRKVDVSGAKPPHADAQARLAFLIEAHIGKGFIVSSELLTRMSMTSDFATDVCVRKDGIDPQTDTRYLEEIAFEICNTQRRRNVTEKAEDMVCRGVRRAFAIFIKLGQVGEWSATERQFVLFEQDAMLEDPVFIRPIPIRALLDRVVSENEVALALITKRNPAIVKGELAAEQKGRKKGLAEGRRKGRREGRREGLDEGLSVGRNLLLGIIQMRSGHVSSLLRQRIESADAQAVQVWGQKLLAGASIEDVFGMP